MTNQTSPYARPTLTCLVSRSVLERAARVRWMTRAAPLSPTDSGWQLTSAIDTTESLAEPGNMCVVDFAQACMIEPSLSAVANLPVGTSLMLHSDEHGTRIFDSRTGQTFVSGGVQGQAPNQYAYSHPVASGHLATAGQPKRRTGMFVTGLVLTIIGALMVLGRLNTALRGSSSYSPQSAAEAAGATAAILLLTIVPIAVGVTLMIVAKVRKR